MAVAATNALAHRLNKRWKSESVPGRIWKALMSPSPDSLRGMYSHTFTPWRWGGAWAVGVALQEAITAAAGGGTWTSLALVAAGSTTTGQVLASACSTRWGKRWAPHTADWVVRDPAHARVTAALGALGATVLHAAGMLAGHSLDTLALGAAGGVVGVAVTGARYWQHHRHYTEVHCPTKTKNDAPPSQSQPLASDVHGRLIQRWPVVNASNGVLPGAQLCDVQRTSFGAVARVQLVPGQQSLGMVHSNLERIASALRIPPAQLEFTPDEPEEGEPDPTVVHLRVVSTQTMRRPVPLDDGRPRVVIDRQGRTLVPVGRYVDGDGEVCWLLYDGSSMWPGYIGGVTGSGKSSLSEALFVGLLESGCTYTIYIDPKGGQSSPRIKRHCHWFIGDDQEQWGRLADGLIAVIHARGRLLAHQGSSGFQPSPEMPGISVLIDEAYEVAKVPNLADKLAWIARKGRSVGVALTLITQGYGLDDFGGVDALRSNTGVVNAFALKLKANQASVFSRDFPHLPNPALLPDTERQPHNKGLAVALNGRPSILRTAWSPPETTDRLMAQARATTIDDLDPYTVAALDEGSDGLFARRRLDAQTRAAAAAVEIEELTRRGRDILRGQADLTLPKHAAGTASTTPTLTTGRAQPPSLPARVLVDLESWKETKTQETKAASPAARAILDLLAMHPQGMGTQQIIAALKGHPGCGSTAIKMALRSLHQQGAITKGSSRKDPWTLCR